MFGISADVPVTMADYYAGLHPEDREATSAAFASALDPDRRALYDVEYRTVGKEDGVVRWVAAKGRGIFEGGRCVRVIGTAIDVTARKQAEEALRASEAQFRVLSQVLPNFVWATDAGGAADWFNERVYAYAGREPGTLDGAGWRGIIHPDDRDRVDEEWRAAVRSRADYQSEYRLRRADGAYRWFLGENDRNVPLADLQLGSCLDGVTPHGANQNVGAESLLAFQLAYYGYEQLLGCAGPDWREDAAKSHQG